MKVECELNGHTCYLPEFIAHFFTKSSLMYCSTINSNRKPHIQPIMFVIEKNKCILFFLAYNKSITATNLYANPNVAFTIDKTHPKNPFWNNGIMIEAISQMSKSQEDIQMCYDNLQKKYGSEIITKVLGVDIISNYSRVRALPTKIIFWKGPYFKKFKCKYKKKEILEKLLKK